MIGKGTRLKDRYRLERPLGRGGMASVWLATDEVLERPVAIKVLADTIASDPEFLARFRREARLAAGLSHPNLIGVYDYAEGEERPYLVMEYVSGETLSQRMSRGAAIDCEQLAHELLGALAHIHAAGIVHRDIKPQNVLIGPGGEAKLIDFGIALPRDATSLTQTGHLLGTARFIAPEVMEGMPATERSDLYSCGVLLRDCVGRARGRLGALADRLSARDPSGRPSSAAAAASQLGRRKSLPTRPTEPLAAPPQPTAVPPQPTEPLRPPPDTRRPLPHARRPAWGRVAAMVAIVAAFAATALLVAGGPSDSGGGGQVERSAVARGDGGGKEAESRDAPEATTSAPEPVGNDPALGSALNQEGFEMVQAGRYEEAVPVLEEAVRAFPPETADLNYAYALFNLGNALRLSGRPEEAIPVLERRLEIPDQTDVVSRELAAARSAAG